LGGMQKTAVTGLYIKGNVTSEADFYFDGEIEGTIEARRGVVTIGPNGRVMGRIWARHLVVGGVVTGDVFALERLELKGTGSLHGNVWTGGISMAEGSYFKGRVDDVKAFENSGAFGAKDLQAADGKAGREWLATAMV
jgi:cytoskeletal protein CcmA (bactofilin family)